jgi:hypothetical protein
VFCRIQRGGVHVPKEVRRLLDHFVWDAFHEGEFTTFLPCSRGSAEAPSSIVGVPFRIGLVLDTPASTVRTEHP